MTLDQLREATRRRGVFPTLDAMRRLGMSESEIRCFVSRSRLSRAEKAVYDRLIASGSEAGAQFVT